MPPLKRRFFCLAFPIQKRSAFEGRDANKKAPRLGEGLHFAFIRGSGEITPSAVISPVPESQYKMSPLTRRFLFSEAALLKAKCVQRLLHQTKKVPLLLDLILHLSVDPERFELSSK